ncbi:MAG: WecB/TagA/CpsF family glycosyltransferase [Chloroflexi bacterium]|nr:MAG: WecB/TagA/CpsF family glycosyltransferase [Chloroflexota bacterium]
MTEARILGVRVDCLGMGATLGRIEQFVDEGGTHLVATVNPEFVMRAQRDREFARVLESAGLCLPDGMGVVWAARRQGCALRETVSGVDLIEPLAAMCARRGFRLFLLGAAPGVAGELAATLRLAHPTLEVASHSGGPEPAQELWIDRLRNRLGVAVAIGVGGAFDFLTGRVPRAPAWMRKAGLEWLFRLLRQPWRIRRMAVLPIYAVKVLSSAK